MNREGPLGARKSWEPSRMRMYGPVTLEDALSSLVGQTARIESNTGKQLEILRARAVKEKGNDNTWAAKPAPQHDPWQAMDRAEQAVGLDLGVSDCLDDLAKQARSWVRALRALTGLQAQVGGRPQGELAIGCLRAFYERANDRRRNADPLLQVRALAEVFVWAKRQTGEEYNAEAVALDFWAGKRIADRKWAAGLYGDSLIVLDEWIKLWNKHQFRETT